MNSKSSKFSKKTKLTSSNWLSEILVDEHDYSKVIESNSGKYVWKDGREKKDGMKHLVFLGSDKKNSNLIYFFSTTTSENKELIKSKDSIKFKTSNHKVYLQINKIYSLDRDLISKNALLNNLNTYRKNQKKIIKNLSKDNLNFLRKNTDLKDWSKSVRKNRRVNIFKIIVVFLILGVAILVLFILI